MLLIINNHTKDLRELKAMLADLRIPFAMRNQDAFDKASFTNIRGVILTGGYPALDRPLNFKNIRADLACLLNFNVPTLGICLGHEIICYACGSGLQKLTTPSLSPKQNIHIHDHSTIFRGLAPRIAAYEHHSRYVRTLSSHLTVIASSAKDHIEAVAHKTKPLFGVQFHPEKSQMAGQIILKNFAKICGLKTKKA